MINLKIQQFISSVNSLCMQYINDGVPVYAVYLSVKDIADNGLLPLVNQAVKKEHTESLEAKQLGEQKSRSLKEGAESD